MRGRFSCLRSSTIRQQCGTPLSSLEATCVQPLQPMESSAESLWRAKAALSTRLTGLGSLLIKWT